MNIPSTQANIAPIDIHLNDLFDLHKTNWFLNFNCHHTGTIQTFDASNQTATAKINYVKTFYQLDPQTNTYNSVPSPYPLLADCPVICLGGGTSALTFPIAAGDECLIFFNDRDMDNWIVSGETTNEVNSSRLHSFADGIILVGLRSYTKSIQNYDANRAVLRNGSAAVGVRSSNSKVLITNNYPTASVTLNSILQTLISNLQSLITQTAAITVAPGTFNIGGNAVVGISTPPVNATSIAAISSQLSSVATQLGNLLE